MKQLTFWLCLGSIMLSQQVFAQSPQAISYQAVARNGNNLLTNSFLQARFSIESGGNVIVYQEEQNVQTNAYGLFVAEVGLGTPTQGTFASVNWENGNHFLEVEINIGNGYVQMGKSQILSVPYSLYAEKAGSADLSLDELTDVSASAPAPGDVLKWDGTQWVQEVDNVNDADNDPANELQSLSLSGSDLTLSNGGGTVTLPTGTTYSAGNGITISGTTITNSQPDQTVSIAGGGATTVTGTYPNFTISSTDNVDDGDPDAGNEIQNLSLSGSTLSLSNGGGSVTLPVPPAYTAGTGISISGNTITNTQPNQVVTISGTGTNSIMGGYPNFTIDGDNTGTLADMAFVSGSAAPPNDSVLVFVSPVASVNISSSSQEVLVISNRAFGSTLSGGGTNLNMYVGYRLTSSSAVPNLVGGGSLNQRVPQNSRIMMGLSARVSGLTPGNYHFGLVGSGINWNSNEWGYTTVLVFN